MYKMTIWGNWGTGSVALYAQGKELAQKKGL